MVELDKVNMTEETKEEEMMGSTAPLDSENQAAEDEAQNTRSMSPKDFREISYFILFIAAVFVINAMETGSYRTPWPVAIAFSAAGLGLYGYSWYRKSLAEKERKRS